jgi:hypothetical protein
MLDRMWTRAAQPRPARLLAAVFLLGAFALSGCGGATIEHGALLRLRIDEYDVSPGSVSIGAGTLRIVLHNSGVLVHELTLDQGTSLIAVTPPARPGQTVTSRPFIIRPGHYKLFDPIANYEDLGAYAALTVTAR